MKIANNEVPENKHIFISLTYIKGIGVSTAKKILQDLSININKRTQNLDSNEINSISVKVDNYVTEGNLVKKTNYNIKKLIEIKSYRGSRHKLGLPVRGQKTHSNAKTRKKNRKSII